VFNIQGRVSLARRVRLAREEVGQTMAEYALILAGVAVIVGAVVLAFGNTVKASFNSIISTLGG